MAEIMSSCYRPPHEWLGLNSGKKRQLMSVDGKKWKKQKTSTLSLNEENNGRSTSATELAVSVEMSPGRAMRAAMLKTRFADAISKAALVLQGDKKSDVLSLPQQRPPLVEKKHQLKDHTRKGRSEAQTKAAEAASPRKEQHDLKKKASSEAQIKAAEAASPMKEQYDLKKRHERERKAARMALQMIEKSVYVDQSAASMLKDLEKLMGLPFGTGLGYPNTKQLERLGLYVKADNYLEQDDVEEGEILS